MAGGTPGQIIIKTDYNGPEYTPTWPKGSAALHGLDDESAREIARQITALFRDELAERIAKSIQEELPMKKMPCEHCGEDLIYIEERGWCHDEGGNCVMHCSDCDWVGAPYPPPTNCPGCDSNKIEEDHCGNPILN